MGGVGICVGEKELEGGVIEVHLRSKIVVARVHVRRESNLRTSRRKHVYCY